MGRPATKEQTKSCKICGKEFGRRRFNGRLEDMGRFLKRKHCSRKCANTRVRPKHWETHHWRARKHRGSSCEACGSTEKLHAHHVDGHPKNNSPENIQTLCAYCHNFLHATADRLGWTIPGRLPTLRGHTELKPSETRSSRKSPNSSDTPSPSESTEKS